MVTIRMSGLLVVAGAWAGVVGGAAWAAQEGNPAGDPAPSAVTAAGVTLHSVNVELPTSDRVFPGGDAAQALTDNCTACHSPGMVLTQPAMSRAAWQAEVDKMRGTFKAPVADEDVPAIVGYLASHKGTP